MLIYSKKKQKKLKYLHKLLLYFFEMYVIMSCNTVNSYVNSNAIFFIKLYK